MSEGYPAHGGGERPTEETTTKQQRAQDLHHSFTPESCARPDEAASALPPQSISPGAAYPHPPTTRRRTGDGYPDVRREQSPPAYHTSCCSILWWHLHRKSAELQSPRPLQWFGQFADAGATHARSSTLTTRKRIETAESTSEEKRNQRTTFQNHSLFQNR